ncbi:transcriptional regulator family: Fungal Specific TF [Penicillium roqueforti]|uniref:transcriptional regulator family: Fungal Specific TF n=1 Tax=Penicillium roqueforti TaxID=5082 RepID=UPI00190C1F7A|nr:transcriptional regulator family: Fungal Specific TF [Penicillium roqueforti]KAF9239047.1 transcriptional regulator family: Fungal Specific TF [Penicillium roqueforti]KAI1830049.1 transcriptional regulator family: Fungal Specific TF [Penicillium roqueforti]KAI2726634.1 transcriptional regulator family: Fungal Specific TF [Penicillium roqueforti]KAI2760203.1 transcriptional regulator family: Fungal Specific TF [Penicillium roqueforti]KAI3100431.1 transcriptional regulator family: Fungal Spec
MSDQATNDPIRAQRACYFCHKRKIKCNRETPECSACKRHQRVCSYKNNTLDLISDQNTTSSTAITVEEPPALQPGQSPRDRTSVACRFLDHEVFQRSKARLSILPVPNLIPSYVRPFMGDNTGLQRIATRYYQCVHPWLPIISKRKVYDQLLNPLSPLRTDAVFLCLCMDLFSPLQNDNPWTPLYSTIRRLFTEMQVAGILSMETLQGCILLAVYEIGHAMYPAVQVSIGLCLKYSLALGIGWTSSVDGPISDTPWVEAEERRRTWWAIFMLERIANLGNPRQELLVSEPALTEQLPCQEKEWDYGGYKNVFSTLSAPPESLGRYANVVQAGYLLGRVLLHDLYMSIDIELRKEEVSQLEKTLHALISYSESNAGTTYSIICYQTAISFCALLTLYAPYLSHEEPNLRERANAVSNDAASFALAVAEEYMETESVDLTHGDIPPFVLHWFYLAGVRFIVTSQLRGLGVIETALEKLNAKWKSAGIYLELLAARRIMDSIPT